MKIKKLIIMVVFLLMIATVVGAIQWYKINNEWSVAISKMPDNKANIYLNKSGYMLHWICDYSTWGECTIDVNNKRVMCDSNRDGNGDGICQSGESCLILNISKQGFNKVKNEGFHNVLDRFDIQCELQ